MKNYRVTISGDSGKIAYDVFKTEKGAYGAGRRIAREAFWGEGVTITVVALQ